MNYSVSVSPVSKADGNLKGFANVVFGGSFKVSNVAILENKNGELFVSMPSYKSTEVDEENRSVFKDVCNPITKEFREELYGDILAVFENRQEQRANAAKTAGQDVEMPEFVVKMTPYEREGSNIRGIGRVYFEDRFVVSNVLVLQGKDKLFVSMPNYRTGKVSRENKPVYQDICYPVTKEFREKLYDEILNCYQKEREKAVSERKEGKAGQQYKEASWKEQEAELPFR